jgi:hypothetical protein
VDYRLTLFGIDQVTWEFEMRIACITFEINNNEGRSLSHRRKNEG